MSKYTNMAAGCIYIVFPRETSNVKCQMSFKVNQVKVEKFQRKQRQASSKDAKKYCLLHIFADVMSHLYGCSIGVNFCVQIIA